MNTSKLPNLDEISHMAGKLFNDLKTSVTEIYDEYKKNHPDVCEVCTTNTEDTVVTKQKQAGKTDNETGEIKK